MNAFDGADEFPHQPYRALLKKAFPGTNQPRCSTLLFMSTNLFDDEFISEKTDHLQGPNKILAGTVWALFTCTLVILATHSAYAVTPELPSNKWMVELPQEESQVVIKMLRSGQFAQLDQRYNTFQEHYEHGTINDYELSLTYQAFYDTSPDNEAFLNQWISKNPTSYPARLARGIYVRKLGDAARGAKFANETAPDKMIKMQQYLERANQDLLASLKLSQKPIVALLHLINISMFLGDKQASLAWLNYSNRVDPNNYGIKRRYLLTLTPRWGGSYDQMWAFLKACQDQHTSQEFLRIFESTIYLDQAKSFAEQNQRERALPLYKKALNLLEGIDNKDRLDALKGVVYNGANPTNLMEYSREIDETLRLAPTERMILGYRSWIRMKQGRYEEGIRDCALGAELGDPYSQFLYGFHLYHGVPPTLPRNQTQGLVWIRKAAEQEDTTAQQFLVKIGEGR